MFPPNKNISTNFKFGGNGGNEFGGSGGKKWKLDYKMEKNKITYFHSNSNLVEVVERVEI